MENLKAVLEPSLNLRLLRSSDSESMLFDGAGIECKSNRVTVFAILTVLL